MTELSVVIPTLNEAATLPALLDDLCRQQDCAPEIIVVDGGSTDGTREAVAAPAIVLAAPRGRGAQMNAGAVPATGQYLLFLHADSRLQEPTMLRTALDRLQAEIGQAGSHRVAGHFALQFIRATADPDRLFERLEAKSGLNRPGTINGDQGCLLPAAYFRELGGFDEGLPFLEDQRLAARIFDTGRWVLLPHRLRTSARRFETEGTRERLALMALLMGAYGSGFESFLRAAPDIYASQDRAKPLHLAPFYRRCRTTLRQQGWRGMASTLFRAGRYVRRNCWQLFWWRDHRRHHQDAGVVHPALDFFDRRVAPLLDNRGADALAAALVTAWLFAWLPIAENQRR